MTSMTSISDISDFARIIREQPEWADTIRSLLLGKELLELPQQFAEFADLTTRNFQLVNARLERLEADMAQVKDDLAGLKTEATITRTLMNQINGRLDNGFGMNYQYKVENALSSIAGQHLGVRRVRVIKGTGRGTNEDFSTRVDEAVDDGVISEAQGYDLLRMDLIFSSVRNSDKVEILVAAELSITIGNDDITRATTRAALLRNIFDEPVEPVVIGANIDNDRIELARANNVTVVLEPSDY